MAGQLQAAKHQLQRRQPEDSCAVFAVTICVEVSISPPSGHDFYVSTSEHDLHSMPCLDGWYQSLQIKHRIGLCTGIRAKTQRRRREVGVLLALGQKSTLSESGD